MKRYGDIVQY